MTAFDAGITVLSELMGANPDIRTYLQEAQQANTREAWEAAILRLANTNPLAGSTLTGLEFDNHVKIIQAALSAEQ